MKIGLSCRQAVTIDRKDRQDRKGAAGAVGDGPPANGRRLTQVGRIRKRMRHVDLVAHSFPDPAHLCASRCDAHRRPLPRLCCLVRTQVFACFARFAVNSVFAAFAVNSGVVAGRETVR
jgi:hypothetical protein